MSLYNQMFSPMESYIIFTVFNFLPHTIFFLLVAALVAVFFLKVQKSTIVRVRTQSKPLYNSNRQNDIQEVQRSGKVKPEVKEQLLLELKKYRDVQDDYLNEDVLLELDNLNRDLDKKLQDNLVYTFMYSKYLDQNQENPDLASKLSSLSDEFENIHINILPGDDVTNIEVVSDQIHKFNVDELEEGYDIENGIEEDDLEYADDYDVFLDDIPSYAFKFEDDEDNSAGDGGYVEDHPISEGLSTEHEERDWNDQLILKVKSEWDDMFLKRDLQVRDQALEKKKFVDSQYESPSQKIQEDDNFGEIYDMLFDTTYDEYEKLGMLEQVGYNLRNVPGCTDKLLYQAGLAYLKVGKIDPITRVSNIYTVDIKQLRELLISITTVNADNLLLFFRILRSNNIHRKLLRNLYDKSYKDGLRIKSLKLRILEQEKENRSLKKR